MTELQIDLFKSLLVIRTQEECLGLNMIKTNIIVK